MRVDAKFDFASDQEILRRLNVQTGGLVQKVIDEAVIRKCEPYVPFDEGVLTASASLATDIGSGLVVYNTPYAHYQYYGEIYGPNFQVEQGGEMVWRSPKGKMKKATGRKLSYHLEKHPLAGSHWFERMMANHKDEILEEAKAAAGVK